MAATLSLLSVEMVYLGHPQSCALSLRAFENLGAQKDPVCTPTDVQCIRPDFREGDEDSNFSVFRVRRFTERPEPLH